MLWKLLFLSHFCGATRKSQGSRRQQDDGPVVSAAQKHQEAVDGTAVSQGVLQKPNLFPSHTRFCTYHTRDSQRGAGASFRVPLYIHKMVVEGEASD